MRSMTLKVPETDDPAVADVADSFAALAAAFSHIEDSAIVYSADSEIVVWNHGAEALYGYTFEEARAKDVSFLCPPEDSGDTIKLFVRALSGQSVAPVRSNRFARTDAACVFRPAPRRSRTHEVTSSVCCSLPAT
jgi:PAS domain S-box-containing protein